MTEIVFATVVVWVAAQRLAELRQSTRNERRILQQGGREHSPRHFRAMQALHTAWLLSMVVEVWLLSPPFLPGVAVAALAVFCVGQWLRLSARRALGNRWTVRILTLPGEEPVESGIYRFIRHPNYLGVVLEIAALPLLHCAVYTTIFFSLANAALLYVRIRREERALSNDSSYARHFSGTPRFVPRMGHATEAATGDRHDS